MKKNKTILLTVFTFIFVSILFAAEQDDFFHPFKFNNNKVKYYKYNESPRGDNEKLIAARGYLSMGCLPDAISLYKNFFGGENRDKIELEYAYALALSGFYEEALLYLDNARKKNPSNPAPYFYAGIVYFFAGYSDIATEMLKISMGEESDYDNIAKEFLNENKTIGVLSFATLNSGLSNLFNIDSSYGVVVLNTYPGSEKLQSELQTGDLILTVNSKRIEEEADIKNIIKSSSTGDVIKLEIIRKGKKIILPVKIFSKISSIGLPQATKMEKQPEKKDLEKLASALTLLSEQNYFSSILLYRKLIDKYPAWDLPYTGSILALTNTGAFDIAIKYAEKSLLLIQDKENKIQISDKLHELKSLSYEDKKNWRKNQKKQAEDTKRNFFIGFGGGQISIGGDAGFSAAIKARAGFFLTDNMDFSIDVSYITQSGVGAGINLIQRYYFIENISLNYGIVLSYNTGSGNFSGGLSGGGSYYTDKLTSYDIVLNLILLPSQDINFYFGMTRYL